MDHISRNKNKPNQTFNFKYDDNRNLIGKYTTNEWSEYLTETEWKDNRIFLQSQYTISMDNKKKEVERKIEYDRLFNPVNVKIYENFKLLKELKYTYEFDNFGNWTERSVFMKENLTKSDRFIKIYMESRELKYWN